MQNTLAIVITSQPNSNLTTTAINLIIAALKEDVNIIGVFFYQDGVLNAASNLSFPSDEYQALAAWSELNHQHKIPLFICNTAAEKRGLLSEPTMDKIQSINNAFTAAGLGELAEMTASAQRVVQL